MAKRPRIKGRGVDIYLGGDTKERPAPQPIASDGASAIEKLEVEKKSEPLAKLRESFCGPDVIKKVAARYLEKSEKLASQAIELQEKSMGWAKETPLAPLLKAQISFVRKLIEASASSMRTLWQID